MSTPDARSVLSYIEKQRQRVIDLQTALTAIPALCPTSGGEGERRKADYLLGELKSLGFTDIRELNAPDPRVPSGHRPNIAAIWPGADVSRTLWLISHTDIVPPGDLSLWQSPPYELRVDGDFIYGRGVQDNQQGIVSSLLAAEAFIRQGVTPKMNIGLLFVADEETGSVYGLEYIVDKHPDLFGPNDLFLIPDFGNESSTLVETAEKSIFWLKVKVYGKQCHGSRPDVGVNSLLGAAALIMRLRGLYKEFDARDDLFTPPYSTFEATKKEGNVPNVNTIPGLDIFYLDCRVMPEYDLDEVMAAIRRHGEAVEKEYGVRFEYEFEQRSQAAPPSPTDSEVVTSLLAAIREVYGVQGVPQGIGGGTVAAFLRRKGHPAAVWTTWFESVHQPNEFASITNTIRDGQVMARMLL